MPRIYGKYYKYIYDIEEVETKKYAVNRYLEGQMTNDKSVKAQSHMLQKLAHEILSKSMAIDE